MRKDLASTLVIILPSLYYLLILFTMYNFVYFVCYFSLAAGPLHELFFAIGSLAKV